MSEPPKEQKKDWQTIQKRVFARWINAKIAAKKLRIKETEILTCWKSGWELVALIESLSNTECPYKSKMRKEVKMKVHNIDNLNWALKYCWESEVKLELKPSAENLFEGDERAIMGLIWGIMRSFLKIQSDDPRLNAEKALKQWVRNTTAPYKNVNVVNFSNSWHNGLAFCGLIHAYNPKLIGPWEELDPSKPLENIKKAMDAAEKFFGLEQYLSPDEIEILDEKSMIIYVSEYYYGLTKHGKVKTAANRVRGLIEESKVNEQMKNDYNKRARELREHLNQAQEGVGEGKSDGTLEGAERKVKEFYELRDKTRGPLLSDFLALENLYNNITMRLSDQKRPEFKTEPGLSLPELRTSFNQLERAFKDVEAVLLAELNRQRQMAKLNNQHEARCNKIKEWGAQKQKIVAEEITVDSTGTAQFYLNQLQTLSREAEVVQKTSVVEVKKLGARLVEMKYEQSAVVLEREAQVDALFPALAEAVAAKQKVLEDGLHREEFKEKVRISELNHSHKHQEIKGWVVATTATLESLRDSAATLEGLDSANWSLSQLSRTKEDVKSHESDVNKFKDLGAKLRDSKYEGLTSWSFDQTEAVDTRESEVVTAFASLESLIKAAQEALDDAHEREKVKTQVRLWDRAHSDQHRAFMTDLAAIRSFLESKQAIDSVQSAKWATQMLHNNHAEREAKRSQLENLKALGTRIREAKHGSWTFDKAEEVSAREAAVEKELAELDALAAEQDKVYAAALETEKSKDAARVQWANEANEFQSWAKDQKEEIDGALFGSSLAEVESYDIAAQDGHTRTELESRLSSAQKVAEELKSTGVTESRYSSVTLDDLKTSAGAVEDALKQRGERYATDLAKRRADEALCKEFAALANPITDLVNGNKDKISNPTESLDEQLKYVQKLAVEAKEKEAGLLGPVDAKQAQLDAAGITSNPHCLYTGADIRATWDQYKKFIQTKEQMLKDKIEHDKYQGLTPEQWALIQETWTKYDKDKSGELDSKEFKDCIFTMGEAKDDEEVAKLMGEFGKDGKMQFEGFKRFMIQTLGNVKNKGAIEESFDLLTGSKPLATLEQLSEMFTEAEVAYIKERAPKREDGLIDWRAWVEAEYS